MKEQLWELILSVRERSPLVHNITNYVVMNNTANALLAIGASPIMAHAAEETDEIVSICQATVINIGTLDQAWIQSMLLAAQSAREKNKPWILDPVGAGASQLRNQTVQLLLQYKPDVIRGNASEILSLANMTGTTKGVDSTNESTEAIQAGRLLNRTYGSTVCISGQTDIILDSSRISYLYNGHPLMQQVTGLGCSATAVCGAFLAIEQDTYIAAVAAMALFSLSGELAQQHAAGPGSLQVELLNKLYNITEDEFFTHLKLDMHEQV